MNIRLCIFWLAGVLATPVMASETVTYTYDALGRLVTVQHSGTINAGLKAQYGYDNAGNRTNATVTGAPPRVIVVPLNGFTVIPIDN